MSNTSTTTVTQVYPGYNHIIPIGDHCTLSIVLKELGLRFKSYPFDWVVHTEQLFGSNILYNVDIIRQMYNEPIQDIVKKYIGDAFDDGNNTKINKDNNIWFAHDNESVAETKADIFLKYERRFTRLKEDLDKKNIFILLTRCYYINEDTFEKIIETLLSHNNDSIIIFISGINHIYFQNIKYHKKVIYKHIDYDASQFYAYDYSSFRPAIKTYLESILKYNSI